MTLHAMIQFCEQALLSSQDLCRTAFQNLDLRLCSMLLHLPPSNHLLQEVANIQ